MTRNLIAAVIAGVIGMGVTAQASANDWHRDHDRWQRNHQRAWYDRNHDGRIDWRDRRHHRYYGDDSWRYRHSHRYDWRDRNHDGRVDRRDRRYYYYRDDGQYRLYRGMQRW